jgi:hypothetical protein
MSGINNALSGFIQLTVGSTQLNPTALQSITNNSHPVTISFAPRSTVPELQGNMILEATADNTCTYKGNVYEMVDVQICSLMNKGYQLTGDNTPPVAELIITFAPKQNLAGTKVMDGILLCSPIYDSGVVNYESYLKQLIDPNMPVCSYTNNPGTRYTEGTYKQGNNSSLLDCVKSCCDDPNCISYNFVGGKCSLNNVVSSSTTAGSSDSSGTVNHGAFADNTGGKRTAITPTLQSIFYNSNSDVNVDTAQKSLAYATTFDTVNGNNQIVSTKTLFIVVFPTGIHMAPAAYQQLLLQMRSRDPSITSALRPYYVPLRVRNYENTVQSFTYDSSGNKIPQTTSNKGEISTLQISNCDEQFKNRFEWFTKPPLVSSKSSSLKSFNSEKCPYYKTSQYKCVPFDQLHDLSGNAADPQDAYVIPGNSALQSILNKKQPSNAASVAALEAEMKTTEDIITYGSASVVGIVFIYIAYKVLTKIAEDA